MGGDKSWERNDGLENDFGRSLGLLGVSEALGRFCSRALSIMSKASARMNDCRSVSLSFIEELLKKEKNKESKGVGQGLQIKNPRV